MQRQYWIGTVQLERESSTELLVQNLQRVGAVYAVYQLECGESTRRAHWQIYLCLGRSRRMPFLTGVWPGSHWEARRGSHEQAKEYCSKEDTRIDGPWTYGVEPESRQGTRTDLACLRDALQSGESDRELWRREDTFSAMLKYHKSIPLARNALSPYQERRMPRLYILWGAPGTGKSARCQAYATELEQTPYRVASPMGKGMPVWWDGYIDQEFIIVDDFYGWIQFTKVIKLCDRYEERVDYRGGSTVFRGTIICITSNIPPERWWPNIPTERYGALQRRITKCVEVKDIDEDIEPFPKLAFDSDKEN